MGITQELARYCGGLKFIKNRAKYPTCKGGDESPRAEGTGSMI